MEEERVSTTPKIFNPEIKNPPHVFYIYAGIYSVFIVEKDIALLSFYGHEEAIQQDGPGLQGILLCKEAQ